VKEENLASQALQDNVDMLMRELGVRTVALWSDYNAPTMWGSIGAVGLNWIRSPSSRKSPQGLSHIPSKIE
jgi:hypothetical protein